MSTVQVSVGFTPSDMIHTWVDITGPDGITHGYGFYPTGNILGSPGEIKDDTQFEDVASTTAVKVFTLVDANEFLILGTTIFPGTHRRDN